MFHSRGVSVLDVRGRGLGPFLRRVEAVKIPTDFRSGPAEVQYQLWGGLFENGPTVELQCYYFLLAIT